MWRNERLKSHNKRVAFEAARKELATARTAEQNISVDGERSDKMAATSAKDVETAKKTAEAVWVVEHATRCAGAAFFAIESSIRVRFLQR